MKTKAQELMAIVSKSAAQVFKERGEIIPILHMVDEFNNHIPIHWTTGFENYSTKDMTANIMRRALRAANAQRYALVIEAWTVDERGDTKSAMEMQGRGESLERHPDRIEVITIFVEDKNTKERLSRWYRILRPEHGKATLAPPRDIQTLEGVGRFNNLFEEY